METMFERKVTEINCWKDVTNNYHRFSGQYLYYNIGEDKWRLLGDIDENYKLSSRLFNILNNNMRVFYYKDSPKVGVNSYCADNYLSKRLENYDGFLRRLMRITKDKKFTSLAHVREYLLDYNLMSESVTIYKPIGIQGRNESVGNLVIEDCRDKIIFLPYYRLPSKMRQKSKIFRTLLSIYIELYRPDLKYPYAIEGDKKTFEEEIEKLYNKIAGEF